MVFREFFFIFKKIFEKKPRKRLILARDIGLLALLNFLYKQFWVDRAGLQTVVGPSLNFSIGCGGVNLTYQVSAQSDINGQISAQSDKNCQSYHFLIFRVVGYLDRFAEPILKKISRPKADYLGILPCKKSRL